MHMPHSYIFTTHIYNICAIHTTHPQTHIYTEHMHIAHTYTKSDLKKVGGLSVEFNCIQNK